MLAVAGVMIALGSLVALYISETSSLFGFSESGYRVPIIIAIVAEVVTILLLEPPAAVGLRGAWSLQQGGVCSSNRGGTARQRADDAGTLSVETAS